MRIAAWIISFLLLAGGIALCVDALTTTHSVWLSIPMLLLAGSLLGPGLIALLGVLGLYDLVIEVNGHRLQFRKPAAD
jgi:hypothetical protein